MDYSNSYFPFFTKTYNRLKKEVRDLNLADFKKNLAEDMKPSKRKHYNVGHKYANTLLTSIRVGHSKLNSDTYKLGMTQGKIDLRNESGRPMKVKVVGEVSEK